MLEIFMPHPVVLDTSVCRQWRTGTRRITTFRSTTDRIYDGVP